MRIGIIDLPGTYASALSQRPWVARRAVLDWQPDVVIMVLDATNLARTSTWYTVHRPWHTIVAALNLDR